LVRGFKWSFTKAVDEWKRGAEAIVEFQRTVQPARPELHARIVKYEDIVAEPRAQLETLLQFCELDPARFDFDAAVDAPVIGSSFVRTDGGKLTWKPRQREEGFDPTARHSSWRRTQHERFEHVAGDLQRALGYESTGHGGASWALYNAAGDVARPIVRARDAAVAGYLHRRRASRRAGDA
jgi:hypothetical protein